MTFLELHDVSKCFGSLAILRSVTLSIDAGQLVVIVGPSGCGKTTLLRIIAGLEVPDQGEIRADGRSLRSVPPHRREIGFVFQDFALYPHMTVRENLAFPLRSQGVARSDARRRADDLAADLRIANLMDRFPGDLSGGERQRVAIGRAIVRRPRVLLLDEPLSQLDAILRMRLRSELVRLHHSIGTTTLLVTHDASEAMAVADRVVVMRQGEVIQQGTADGVYAEPANRFVAEFFGTRPMNFLDATADAAGVRWGHQVLPIRLAIDDGLAVGRSVALGFRPDAVRVDTADEQRGLCLEGTFARSHREEGCHVLVAQLEESNTGRPSVDDSSTVQQPLVAVLPSSPRSAAPGNDAVPRRVGERVRWWVPLESIYCFDSRTGDRLEIAGSA